MRIISKLLGKFDPIGYAHKEGEMWVITPSTFYPAMIAHIGACLEEPDLPAELIDRRPQPDVDPKMAARRYRSMAQHLPETAWADALLPLAEVAEEANWQRIRDRASALECARLWFTRALKNLEGGPVHIRILGDARFRLGVDL